MPFLNRLDQVPPESDVSTCETSTCEVITFEEALRLTGYSKVQLVECVESGKVVPILQPSQDQEGQSRVVVFFRRTDIEALVSKDEKGEE